MKLFTTLSLLVLTIYTLNAQINGKLSIGIAAGAGRLKINTGGTVTTVGSTTIPNLKIGYQFKPDLQAIVLLPGANYRYNNKDRGFEAFQVGIQYSPQDKDWWFGVAVGPTFDAPAFYTVRNPAKAGFYYGFPAYSLIGGYKVYKKEKFFLDIQIRQFHGKSEIGSGINRTGTATMFLVGANWHL